MSYSNRWAFALNGATGLGCFMFAAVGHEPSTMIFLGVVNLGFALWNFSAAFRRAA